MLTLQTFFNIKACLIFHRYNDKMLIVNGEEK